MLFIHNITAANPPTPCIGSGFIKTDPVDAILNESTTLYIYGNVQPPQGHNTVFIAVYGPNKYYTSYDFVPDQTSGNFSQPFTLDHNTLNGTYIVNGTYCGNQLPKTKFDVLNLIDKQPLPNINYTLGKITINQIEITDSPKAHNPTLFKQGKLGYIQFEVSSPDNRHVVVSIQVWSGHDIIAENWFDTKIDRDGTAIVSAVHIPHNPQWKNVNVSVTIYSDWPQSNSDNVLASKMKSVGIDPSN